LEHDLVRKPLPVPDQVEDKPFGIMPLVRTKSLAKTSRPDEARFL